MTTKQMPTRQAACDRHGGFNSVNYLADIWSKCPVCSREHSDRERDLAERKAAEARLQAWQRKIGGSGIPDRFRDRTLQTFVARSDGQRRALEFCARYVGDFDDVMRTGRSAIFVGKPGTGKTHLACGIGLQVMQEQNRTVFFTTVLRAIRRVKATWARNSQESESDAIEAVVAPDLLILDEVGVQFGSEFERHILFDVLNERYERRRPTILMSNLPASEVTGYLGERVVDRIREDGGARIVFDWESFRKTGEA